MRRSQDEIAKRRKAGRGVAEMPGTTRAALRPGITTAELDRVARQVLERRGARGDVQLCVSGGFREPGDFLKAYALGADAVGLATVVMFALAHPQSTRTVPFYPPTDLVFYRANPAIALDVDRAADAGQPGGGSGAAARLGWRARVQQPDAVDVLPDPLVGVAEHDDVEGLVEGAPRPLGRRAARTRVAMHDTDVHAVDAKGEALGQRDDVVVAAHRVGRRERGKRPERGSIAEVARVQDEIRPRGAA